LVARSPAPLISPPSRAVAHLTRVFPASMSRRGELMPDSPAPLPPSPARKSPRYSSARSRPRSPQSSS